LLQNRLKEQVFMEFKQIEDIFSFYMILNLIIT